LDKYKYEVSTSHTLFRNGEEVGQETLDLEDESLGTKKLFAIGALILDTLDDGGIIVIDELDKGLHPLISKLLINLFNSKKNNPNNAQLIFATHDSTLLDLEILRRDQISFVDKEYEGNSVYYKLSDIKGIRKDMPIDKWYLSGRFKAIPVTNEVNLRF
jgi:AAA15 family ATPase/GTPase